MSALYYLVNLTNNHALDLGPRPQDWANITQMDRLTDIELADLAAFGQPNRGFIPYADIGPLNLNAGSLTSVNTVYVEKAKIDLRALRNEKLSYSDRKVGADLWAIYTTEQKEAISTYREALRDLPDTVENWFVIVWPEPPYDEPEELQPE